MYIYIYIYVYIIYIYICIYIYIYRDTRVKTYAEYVPPTVSSDLETALGVGMGMNCHSFVVLLFVFHRFPARATKMRGVS